MLKESRKWSDEIINELAQASSVLSEILNNTLDMSKLEEGKIDFNNNYDSIMTVIDMVVNITKSNAEHKDIKILTNYGPSIPPLIEFDRSRLTQVIMNFVGNAIKFTPEKGRVTINVKWTPQKPARKLTGRVVDPPFKTPTVLLSPPSEDLDLVKQRSMMSLRPRCQSIVLPSDCAVPIININFDKEEQLPLELVPDEVSPDSSSSPRKIPGKISSHRFITNFTKHFEFRTTRSILPAAVVKRPVERRTGSLTSRTERPDTCFVNSPSCVVGQDEALLYPKSFNDSGMAVFTEGDVPDVDQGSEKGAKPERRLILPWNFNEGVIKLKKMAKEFRFSSKDLPTLDTRTSNGRGPLLPSRNSRTSPKRRTERTKSAGKIPSSAELSPKPADSSFCEIIRRGRLTIEVSDTGCGMTEEETKRLFQPFAQANKGVHAKFGGTGLGLWLSHKLVTAMEGTIMCRSEPEKGTTFTISLDARCKLSAVGEANVW